MVDLRYERKFLVEEMDASQVRALLLRHPAMFRDAYPPRYVNNLYLDTPWLADYVDNVAGVGDRRKVRIRWYHDLFGWIEEPMLEFKVKRGLVGWKETFPFPPFALDAGFSDRDFQKWVRGSDLPRDHVTRLTGLRTTLLNRYRRSYLASCDGRFRVTLDTDLTYYHVHRLRSRFLRREADRRSVVVELKYGVEEEALADRVVERFPFRLSRSSKYILGVERVVV